MSATAVWLRPLLEAAPLAALGRRRGLFPGVDVALAAALGPVALGVEGLAVGQDRVDLPGFAVGRALDPELVLLGVAAGSLTRLGRGEPGLGEARLLGCDGIGVGDLDAEVVEAPALAGVFQQHQLERRLGDGEVGVAGPDLGRLGAEQLAVEGDGLADVVDVEGELQTAGHGTSWDRTSISVYVWSATHLATRHRVLSI